MNNISNKYIMIKEKNDLTQSTFDFIKYQDNKNYQKYNIDHLILLNKKFSYPMFLTSSNKEEVNFNYELYYLIENYRYDYIEEIDELISDDYNYNYKDVKSIIEIQIRKEKFSIELNEILDIVDFSNKEILGIISEKLPIHLWSNKYYIENNKLYKENYL
jgi:hypothetical protein